MTGLIRKAMLLTACGLFVAAAAMAGVPDPAHSTSPGFVRLVGSAAGAADSVSGKFTVVVHDASGNPIPSSNVVVDFSGCTTTDIRVASNQLNANYSINCANHTVAAFTNATGTVNFTLLGNSFLTGVHSGLNCGRIFADGVLLTSPIVSTFDMDGSGGVSGGDLSTWLGDLGSGGYRGRADYDGNGSVSGGDLSVWLGVLGRGKSTSSNVACP